MVDKSKRKKFSGADKISTGLDRRAYLILWLIKDGRYATSQTQIAKRIGMKRRTLGHILKKMIQSQWIYCTNPKSNKFMQYRCTVLADKLLARYESNEQPQKRIGLENQRFKCYIRNKKRLQAFLNYDKYGFKRSDGLKNNIVYDGNIEGVFVRIIHGAREIKDVTLLMISPLFYADSGLEGHFLLWDNIIKFQQYLDDTWQFDTTKIRVDNEHSEYTWNSPLAMAMMDATGGAPIRSRYMSLNASPPSKTPQQEHKSWLDLDEHLKVPMKIDDLKKEILSVKADHADLDYKISNLENNMTLITTDMHEIVKLHKTGTEQNKKIVETVDELRKNFAEMTDILKGKNQPVQEKSAVMPLNESTKQIYG